MRLALLETVNRESDLEGIQSSRLLNIRPAGLRFRLKFERKEEDLERLSILSSYSPLTWVFVRSFTASYSVRRVKEPCERVETFLALLLGWEEWDIKNIVLSLLQGTHREEYEYLPVLLSSWDAGNDYSCSTRRWWIFSKSETWWEECARRAWAGHQFDRDKLWTERFRMPYGLFTQLVNEIQPYMPEMPEWIYARKRVELEKAVAVVLWRLGRNETLLEISDKFHIGQSTIIKYTRIITEILAHPDKLHSHYIGLPRGQRLLDIMESFKQISKVPMIAAAIDGSQIKLKRKPPIHHSPADYWNRHHDYAVQLQGVVDSKRNFLDCAALLPGSQHDAYHLRISSLWHKMVNNLIFQDPVLQLPVVQTITRGRGQNRRQIQETSVVSVRPFIIGDDAYPLTAFLQKAFNKRRVGSNDRNNFDKCLRRSRVRSEHTFALLKGKWRILDTGIPVALEEVSTVIAACCTLHNFVNSRGVQIPPEDRSPNLRDFDPFVHSEPLIQVAESVHARRTQEGNLIREALFQNWLAEGNDTS